MPSILQGTDTVIDEWFDVPTCGKSPHYQHKRTLLQLCREGRMKVADSLVQRLLETVEKNYDAHSEQYSKPSVQNWRFKKRTNIATRNASPEKTLERAIVRVADDCWANEIPSASGLIDDGADRRRCIDLGERRAAEYQLIELKVRSNTPLYAAMEILLHGILYVFCRQRRDKFRYAKKELLEATAIHLRVLAPYEYFEPYRLRWLESLIATGLSKFAEESDDVDYSMSFQFDCFPNGFAWPCTDSELVQAITNRVAIRDYERAL